MTAYAMPPADPTSVVGRRIAAYGIDVVLSTIAVLIALYPMFMDRSTIGPADEISCSNTTFGNTSAFEQPEAGTNLCIDLGDGRVRYVTASEANGLTGAFYLVLFGSQAINLVLLQGVTGASIGKLLLGLRVVRPDGQKAGIGWAALRWGMLFIDSFCCFLPGAVLVFATKGHRRLGDMAASTFVVATRSVGSPVHVPGVSAAGWGPPAGGFAPTAPPAGDGPIWDEARDTYIQYDRNAAQWVQWDAEASQWRPIDL